MEGSGSRRAPGGTPKGPAGGRPRCSFCGRKPKEVQWIYGGSMVAICDGCTQRSLDEMLA
ncbi:MAG: ClpX C4-type zinc finger protein [Actinomycetota bacterium]